MIAPAGWPAIECVAFDFDGVLAQSNALKRRAFFDIFAHLAHSRGSVEAALQECQDCDRYQVIEHILARLAESGGAPADGTLESMVAQFAAAYNDICETGAATCPEAPGASEILARLAGRYPLYIASGTPEAPLRRIVQQRGWAGYFRDVLGRPRNKVENLSLILERERLGSGELLLVGDSSPDQRAALVLGCPFVAVRSDGNDFEWQPQVVIDDLGGLEAVMRRWEGREAAPC